MMITFSDLNVTRFCEKEMYLAINIYICYSAIR